MEGVRQEVPADDLNAIMKETFSELARLSGKPFNENEIPKVAIATSTAYHYDMRSSVLTGLYSEKLMEVNGTQQIQTLKVVLKD